MFSKLFTMMFGGNAVTTTNEETKPVGPQSKGEKPEPSFIFPETIYTFRQEKARLEAELEAAKAEEEKLRGQYPPQAETAEQEIIRRQRVDEINKERERARGRETSAGNELYALEETIRRKERTRYLSEGVEICRSEWKRAGGAYSGADRDESRVVVGWKREILLLQVARYAVTRGTGEYRNCDHVRWEVRERTGEFLPEYVEWLTGSLSQFTSEELRAVTQYQQSHD